MPLRPRLCGSKTVLGSGRQGGQCAFDGYAVAVDVVAFQKTDGGKLVESFAAFAFKIRGLNVAAAADFLKKVERDRKHGLRWLLK